MPSCPRHQATLTSLKSVRPSLVCSSLLFLTLQSLLPHHHSSPPRAHTDCTAPAAPPGPAHLLTARWRHPATPWFSATCPLPTPRRRCTHDGSRTGGSPAPLPSLCPRRRSGVTAPASGSGPKRPVAPRRSPAPAAPAYRGDGGRRQASISCDVTARGHVTAGSRSGARRPVGPGFGECCSRRRHCRRRSHRHVEYLG